MPARRRNKVSVSETSPSRSDNALEVAPAFDAADFRLFDVASSPPGSLARSGTLRAPITCTSRSHRSIWIETGARAFGRGRSAVVDGIKTHS